MPDSPSPFDDPFADLFGKLPDPRERRSAGGDSARGSSGSPASAGDDPAVSRTTPLSRREAREAAARAAKPTGSVASTPETAAAETAAPARAARPAQQTRVPEADEPVAAASQTDMPATEEDEDSWLFGRAAEEPAYARSGGASTVRPAATATLEDLFTGAETTDSLGELPPPKNKRRRRIAALVALGVVLLLLGGIAAGGFYVWNTYEDRIREVMGWEEPKDYEPGMANGEAYVTIESGDTGGPISQALYDAGVTKTPEAFYDYLIDTAQNPPFVPGYFKLQLQMTSAAALEALLDPANKLENTAQVREGLTVEDTLPLLADGIGLPIEDLQAAVATPADYGVAAESLEGWLFPATYTFEPGVTARDVIATLVDRTVQSLDSAGVPVEDRQRILTVASIIQREARFEADFYKVSRVIENRLDPSNQETFGLLQMDSTAQYGFNEDDGTVSTSEEALTDDNPWNTYVRPGLPIGPIANPGDVAIDAAMHPAEGDWLYFVTVNLNTGETVFTTNVDDHNRAVAQWQAWCTDNPDAGC